MSQTEALYLRDIIDAIDKIISYVNEMSYDDFCNDFKTIDAVVRNYEIIGEAAKNVSVAIRNKYLEIPWKEMIGMRNKIIHEYFGVDMDIVWETTQKVLPNLKLELERIYNKEFNPKEK